MSPPPRPVHIYRNVHVGGRHYPYWHCFLTRGPLLSTATRLYRHGAARPVSFEKPRARVKSRLMSRMARLSAALQQYPANLSHRAHKGSALPSRIHREKSRRSNDQLIRVRRGFCKSPV